LWFALSDVASSLAEMLVVYVTAPDEVAPAIAREIVERKLAACVNVIRGVRSIYAWEGAIEDQSESLLIAKTSRASFEAFRSAIVALHPYQVPEIIGLPIEAAHAPYRDWVLEGSTGATP
jgi:periplasmic divalent cation tolerance protein